MSHGRLFWPSVIALAVAAAALILGGATRGTFALYNGETQNASSTFAGGWIGAPGSPTATVSGNNVDLAWTPGTHGPVTGQQLQGVDNGTSSNCAGAAYALLTSIPAATATFSDPRGTAANGGHWFCYKIVSTSATVWTAEAALPSLQLGLAATSIAFANGSTKCSFGSPSTAVGKIDCNDRIVITFNQRPVASGSPIAVCVFTSGTIVLGDSNATKCTSSGNPNTIGTLTGATITGLNASYTNSSVTTSTSAPWTMTITLGGTNITPPSYSGTFTYGPSTSIKSLATSNQATICTTGSTCRPTGSGF